MLLGMTFSIPKNERVMQGRCLLVCEMKEIK